MPQHLPNPQPVRCHLLVGSHAFEFEAQAFKVVGPVPHFNEVQRIQSRASLKPFPVASGSHPGGGTIGPFNGRAANPVSNSVHTGDN